MNLSPVLLWNIVIRNIEILQILSLREENFYLLLPVNIVKLPVTVTDERQKKTSEDNSILRVRTVEMNKVLVMHLKPQDFLGAMTTE